MSILELKPNIKPDYSTDPFSLVLTSSGEQQRSIPSLPPNRSTNSDNHFILVYHAFSGIDAIQSLRWLRLCERWQRVIVSFSGSSEELECLAACDLIDELIPVANQGRNILPLLQICRKLEPESLVLHLHGKQSLPAWREHLEAELIRDPQKRAVHRAWLTEPMHGVIAPATYAAVKPHATWEGNFAIARAVFSQAYPDLSPLSPYNLLSFPAGGMFWFRARVLQRLASVVNANDFPAEPLPADRSIAHALERLIFHCCEAEGLQWAFAHREQGPWPSLTDLPGVLDDWRDHYIALLLPRAHGGPHQPTAEPVSPGSTGLQLKTLMKHWWHAHRSRHQ